MAAAPLAGVGPLLLVGCGKMGGALLKGWLAQGVSAADVIVVEPAVDPARTDIPNDVRVVDAADRLPGDFVPAAVILAVKPQMMGEAVPGYARFGKTETVFLSIAAGTPIAFFERELGDAAAVIRVMPNTPASIGRGMSVLCANARTSPAQREMCGRLMEAVGAAAWLDDEGLMDAVTAVSGSGPAYVFLLIEALADAGRAVGLPDELARQLALQTVAGAGELARQSGDDPAQLRVNVTSPGGTTAAALEVLMAPDGLPALMARAVKAAEQRGRELGA
jgi:pyrroline-5-carboxylate reductase